MIGGEAAGWVQAVGTCWWAGNQRVQAGGLMYTASSNWMIKLPGWSQRNAQLQWW